MLLEGRAKMWSDVSSVLASMEEFYFWWNCSVNIAMKINCPNRPDTVGYADTVSFQFDSLLPLEHYWKF